LSLSLHIKDYSWGSRGYKERHPFPDRSFFSSTEYKCRIFTPQKGQKGHRNRKRGQRGSKRDGAREMEKGRERARSCLDLNSFVRVRVYPTSSSPLFSFSCSRNDISYGKFRSRYKVAERRRRPEANFANFQPHVSRNCVYTRRYEFRDLAPRIQFGGFLIGEHCTINYHRNELMTRTALILLVRHTTFDV